MWREEKTEPQDTSKRGPGAGFFSLVPIVPRPQQCPWMVLDEGFDGFSILLKGVLISLCVW